MVIDLFEICGWSSIGLWHVAQPACKRPQRPPANQTLKRNPLVVVVYRRFPATTPKKSLFQLIDLEP
jgi:hypothetical protein